MLSLYVAMAVMSAGAVAWLGVLGRWGVLAVATLAAPLLALAVYHGVGRPDLPGAPTGMHPAPMQAERNAALLAVRPMQRLLSTDKEDLGALLAMAQLNARIDNAAGAAAYLEQAVRVIARDHPTDPRLPILRRVIAEVKATAALSSSSAKSEN
jgi:cytochrome c-type biogenesis protein CcmH/NrfG